MLPTKPSFKGKKGGGGTERYQRIKKNIENGALLPCMSFVVFVSLLFKPFVLLFQREEPMLHMLHPQMKKLVQDLLMKFVDPKVVKRWTGVNEMLDYDVDKKENFRVQPEMGTKTCSFLDEMVKDTLVKKAFIEEIVTKFYGHVHECYQ